MLLGPHMKMWVPYNNHSIQLSICPQMVADATATKVFELPYPNWVTGPPMRGRCVWAWNFGSVTFDLGAMTLTLGFLWTLLYPRYWSQFGQFLPVTLDPLPWPWDYCGLTVMDPPMAGPLLVFSFFGTFCRACNFCSILLFSKLLMNSANSISRKIPFLDPSVCLSDCLIDCVGV